MRAAHEAELRLRVPVLPDDGIAVLDALKLRVVDHIDPRALGDQRFALRLRLGREVRNVIKAHCAVGCGGRAEVLEIGAGRVVQLRAEPFVEADHIRHILHDLHADGRAKQLCLGLFACFDLHDPGRFAALVGQQSEIRHIAHDGAHDVHDAGVAVAACAEHGVRVHDGGGFRP